MLRLSRRLPGGLLIIVAATLGLAAAPAAADPSPWTVRAVLALATDTSGVSCSSTTSCWAIEAGKLLSSSDAGQHWTDRTSLVPRKVRAIQAVSCPSNCFFTATTASGPAVLVLTADHLTTLAVPTRKTVPAISCVSASRCVATDGVNSFVTTDGAQTWSSHPLPAIIYTTPALDCFALRCVAVGDRGEIPLIEYSADGGATWKLQDAPANTDGMYAVSCPDANTCYAGGATMFPDAATIIATHDRGRTWTAESVPSQPYGVQSMDCVSATSCVAVGYSPADTAFVFTLAGGSWTRQDVAQISTLTPGTVSCPAVNTCAIVAGGLGYYTVDGATWPDQPLPEALEAPRSLSCPSATHCVGVGNSAGGQVQLITSDDAGATWAQHPAPATDLGTISSVDCPSVTTCMAVSDYDTPGSPHDVARAIVTHDGGVTWQVSRMRGAAGVLRTITCPAESTCLASGYDLRSAAKLMATTDGGASWHPLTPPPGFYLNSVACSSTTSCVLIAGDPNAPVFAYTTRDLGQTYTQHSLPAVDEVTGMDCVASLCVAGGYDGGNGRLLVSRNRGAVWKSASIPSNIEMVGPVSCGSPTSCAAGGYDFAPSGGPLVLTTDDAGATWTVHRVPARNEDLIALACYDTACIGSDVSVSGNPIIVGGSV